MKNITLTNETLETLRTLINEIENEESKEDYENMDIDVVTFNQYKIIDIVRELVKETKKTIQVPTVTLKLHLYTTDEDDNYVPMNDEDAEEAIKYITSADDVMGYSITDFEVTTEELDVTDWD